MPKPKGGLWNLFSGFQSLVKFADGQGMTGCGQSYTNPYNPAAGLPVVGVVAKTGCTEIIDLHDVKINNLKPLKKRRKSLRNNLTSAEATLWKLLKKGQLGKKFRRQHSVGPYIIDFYCATEKLAVELDGAHHFTSEGFAHDERRTNYLKKFGIRVIRFENYEVFDATETVLEKIRQGFENRA